MVMPFRVILLLRRRRVRMITTSTTRITSTRVTTTPTIKPRLLPLSSTTVGTVELGRTWSLVVVAVLAITVTVSLVFSCVVPVVVAVVANAFAVLSSVVGATLEIGGVVVGSGQVYFSIVLFPTVSIFLEFIFITYLHIKDWCCSSK